MNKNIVPENIRVHVRLVTEELFFGRLVVELGECVQRIGIRSRNGNETWISTDNLGYDLEVYRVEHTGDRVVECVVLRDRSPSEDGIPEICVPWSQSLD